MKSAAFGMNNCAKPEIKTLTSIMRGVVKDVEVGLFENSEPTRQAQMPAEAAEARPQFFGTC